MVKSLFSGSGAPKGGGSFKNRPDNLRSNDTFEGVLGLCSGPIKGPVRGLKSIKLDGTALENDTGESNFEGFITEIADGDPLQHPQIVELKLGAGGSPVPVNLSLTNTNPSSPGPWIVKTVSNTGAHYLDFRFVVSQLFRQDKKGIYDHTLSIEIQMKPIGTTNWINPNVGSPSTTYQEDGFDTEFGKRVFIPRRLFDSGGNWGTTSSNYQVTGKTTSPAVYELRIAVPYEDDYADVQWDVRARLVEIESTDDGINIQKRIVQWESISAIYGSTMGDNEGWRGLAWLQMFGKASDQLTGVPEVTGEYDTKIVSVPTDDIFNPDTRVYTPGTWDGSWTKAYTNDPAWIINDALVDPLSGLAKYAEGVYLNKWDALEASKWFSEQVSDGAGGTHPRYSLNLAINEVQKAEEFIRYLAGAVGGLAWDEGNGQWRLKVDKPDNPVDIFTLENIDGEFVYSHTDVDTRYNDITGQYKNAEMDYRQDSVHLYDNVSIASIGRKPVTIALVGCTNRQEALRRIKVRIRSSVNETKMVNFTTNRRGRNVEPLDTILIADADLGDMAEKTTGRIVGMSLDRQTITLRDNVRLETGVVYRIRYSIINPNYDPATSDQPSTDSWRKPTVVEERLVTNSGGSLGNVKVLTLSAPLPADTPEFMTVALEAVGLPTTPKLYRVLTVTPDDQRNEMVAISGIEIDVDKWDEADNVDHDDSVFQDLRGAVLTPELLPGRPLISLIVTGADQGSNYSLMANWVRPAGRSVVGFRVRYRVNGGPWQTGVELTQNTDFGLVNPPPGVYQFEITTIGRLGQMSVPLYGLEELTQQEITAGEILFDDGGTIQDYQPDGPGATRNDGGQLLQDTKFQSLYWTLPPDMFSEVDALNPNGFALFIYPYPGNQNFGVYGGTLGKVVKVEPNRTLFGRLFASKFSGLELPVYQDGDPVYDDGIIVTGTPDYADWAFKAKILWYDGAGDFISESVFDGPSAALDVVMNFSAVAPTTAQSARLAIGNDATLTSGSGVWRVWSPWLAEHQPAADITSLNAPSMEIPPAINIPCYSNGTIKPNILPSTYIVRRLRGGVNVSADTIFTATFIGCSGSINNTYGDPDRGLITITDVTAMNASISISTDYAGVLVDSLKITKVLAAVEGAGSTGGGGGGGTTGHSSGPLDVTFSVSSSSYTTAAASTTLTLATGEKFTASVFEEYTKYTIFNVAGKWQYSPTGAGTWTDFDAEVVGEPTFRDLETYEVYCGSLQVNQEATGLTAGDYDIRLMNRRYAGSGSATAYGTAYVIAGT